MFCINLLDESVGMSPLVHQVEHVSDINTDTACEFVVEEDIARQTIPVAVECKSDEFALSVEYRRTAITACDVVVGEEAELHLTRCLVGVFAEIICAHQFVHNRLGEIFEVGVALLHLLHNTWSIGEVARRLTIKIESSHLSVAQSHGEVGIAIVGQFHLHTQDGIAEIALLYVDGIIQNG